MTAVAEHATGRIRWGAVAVAVTVAVTAVAVAGGLGWWQWTRAEATGQMVLPEPSVPIRAVMQPGDRAGTGVGRQVSVEGRWLDEEVFVVTGREVEGEPAQLLVRALEVEAEATGTGEPATLAVIVGWTPADAAPTVDVPEGPVTLTGYLRAPEQSAPAPVGSAVDATAVGAVATSALVQTWPSPLYSDVLVSYEPIDGWRALEPLPPTTELNLRNAAYAIEWWIFGAFAAFVAGRWIRDNGRQRPVTPAEGESPASGVHSGDQEEA